MSENLHIRIYAESLPEIKNRSFWVTFLVTTTLELNEQFSRYSFALK